MRLPALGAVLTLVACPAPPAVLPAPDAGSREDSGAGACPATPCVAGAECVNGVCYSRECGRTVCPPGELCSGARCVSANCAGVRCAFGACVDGRCPACSAAHFTLSDGGCEKKRDLAGPCASDDECVLAHCVDGRCCETPCDGRCERCATGRCTSRPQFDPGAPGRECFPGLCPGGSSSCTERCIIDTHCADGGVCIAGTCEEKRPVGRPCSRPLECANGLCVDRFCCNTACSEPCAQCVLDDGGTTGGICTPSVRHTPASCAPYQCDGAQLSCPMACIDDTDCNAGFFCSAQKRCTPKQAPGVACTRDFECAPGRCNSGYCCSYDCLDGCRNCRSDGGCELLNGPADAGGASCAAGKNFCWQGRCCDTPCTGGCQQCETGTCGNAFQQTPCADRVGWMCDGMGPSCPPTCQGDYDCVRCDYYCSGGACVPDPCNQCPNMCCNPVTHLCGGSPCVICEL